MYGRRPCRRKRNQRVTLPAVPLPCWLKITKEEYGKYGGQALGQKLVDILTSQGKKPYLIPVGGSSPLGCWGYLEMIRELEGQIAGQGFTDVAMVGEGWIGQALHNPHGQHQLVVM